MFSELAGDQEERWRDECPGLEDEDRTASSQTNSTSEASGICDYRGIDALALCDSVDLLAHDDDGWFMLMPKVFPR